MTPRDDPFLRRGEEGVGRRFIEQRVEGPRHGVSVRSRDGLFTETSGETARCGYKCLGSLSPTDYCHERSCGH